MGGLKDYVQAGTLRSIGFESDMTLRWSQASSLKAAYAYTDALQFSGPVGTLSAYAHWLVRKRYKKALEKSLPEDVRLLVQRQYEGALKNHDQIRLLRDEFAHHA